MLAQEFARDHADRLRPQILSDTTLGGDAARPDSRDRLAMRLRAAETMTAAEFARARSIVLAPDPPPAVAQEVETTVARIVCQVGFRNAVIALAHTDTRAVLPYLTVPTLVLCSEHDR